MKIRNCSTCQHGYENFNHFYCDYKEDYFKIVPDFECRMYVPRDKDRDKKKSIDKEKEKCYYEEWLDFLNHYHV